MNPSVFATSSLPAPPPPQFLHSYLDADSLLSLESFVHSLFAMVNDVKKQFLMTTVRRKVEEEYVMILKY